MKIYYAVRRHWEHWFSASKHPYIAQFCSVVCKTVCRGLLMSLLSGPLGDDRRFESYRSFLYLFLLHSHPLPEVLFLEQETSKARDMTWILIALISCTYHLALVYPLARKGGQQRPAQGCTGHRSQPAWVISECCMRRGSLCALIWTPHSHSKPQAHQVLCSGVAEGLLAMSVQVTGPSFLPPWSAAGIAPKKLGAGKLAGSTKGEHLYLCRGWIYHFLMELLAGGRVLCFISIVKHLV